MEVHSSLPEDVSEEDQFSAVTRLDQDQDGSQLTTDTAQCDSSPTVVMTTHTDIQTDGETTAEEETTVEGVASRGMSTVSTTSAVSESNTPDTLDNVKSSTTEEGIEEVSINSTVDEDTPFRGL